MSEKHESGQSGGWALDMSSRHPGLATRLSPMAAMQRGARISREVACSEAMSVSESCIWPILDGGKAPVQAPGQGCRTNETFKLEEKLPVVTH